VTSKARWRVLIAVVVATAAAVIGVAVGLGGNGRGSDGTTNTREPPTMDEEDAKIVKIALAAIGKDMNRLPDKWDVEIIRDENEYVVTWPVRKAAPSLGPEFYCRVYVDRARGVVTRKMVGN
jgi:hypothetical protein